MVPPTTAATPTTRNAASTGACSSRRKPCTTWQWVQPARAHPAITQSQQVKVGHSLVRSTSIWNRNLPALGGHHRRRHRYRRRRHRCHLVHRRRRLAGCRPPTGRQTWL
jgi:hypothetical protein